MMEKELLSMIMDEVKEYNLSKYRKRNDKGYIVLNKEVLDLGIKTQDILNNLDSEKAAVINKYIDKMSALADKDCIFLYSQGAKDCVKLLKNLGVL